MISEFRPTSQRCLCQRADEICPTVKGHLPCSAYGTGTSRGKPISGPGSSRTRRRGSRLSPNPPMDTDGRREDTGRGEEVTEAMVRARIRVDGRLGGGLQALLGAPMAACSGCGEGDGGIGHGERRSRTEMARVGGDVQLTGWRVSCRRVVKLGVESLAAGPRRD